VDEFFVLSSGWRHWNNGAFMRYIQHSFSVHLPPRVRQTRHELVQLSDEVVLDANYDNSRQKVFGTKLEFETRTEQQSAKAKSSCFQ